MKAEDFRDWWTLRAETHRFLARVLQEAEDRDLAGVGGNATSDES